MPQLKSADQRRADAAIGVGLRRERLPVFVVADVELEAPLFGELLGGVGLPALLLADGAGDGIFQVTYEGADVHRTFVLPADA